LQLNLDIPTEIMVVLDQLRAAGGDVWLVGGVVRDALLGRRSEDFDVATSLRPDALAKILPGVNAEFGAVSVTVPGTAAGEDNVGEDTEYEVTVTTLRTDGEYTDQRHPSRVTFVDSPDDDSLRRDFTINAIYADPWTGEVSDPCGGVADVESRTLEVIGAPEERLREDPLRILRAVRFAARMGLTIAPSTRQALTLVAAETNVLSRERVFAELSNAFCGPGRGAALRLLVELAIADHVLPEITKMPGVAQPPEFHPEGDVFVHTCLVLDHTTEGDLVQAWTAVLHDVGKPATFERAADRIRFSGHDTLSAEMADGILRRFKVSRDLREEIVEVCRDHIRFASLPGMKPKRRERWLRSPRFGAHLEFHRADCMGSHAKLGIYEFARREWMALPPEPPPPLCTGADVIALGLAEGPEIGEVLRRLDEMVTEGGVSNRDTALAMLRGIVESHFRGRT
jgi:putative nucleotidyltransferase with HDIG domain